MDEKRDLKTVKEEIIEKLEDVIDPELGVDIVNLGLIYQIDLDKDGACVIQMTLTTMGCPLTDLLADMVDNALQPVPEIESIDVKFVWEPAWTIARMSRYAKMALGIH
ncbi:metal-sulfur cluster assembly factor [Liquorilactobacillus satsumensis]|uniref:metal-sulfur cluster assembly factor n=1 Tax=Liquorilactobacillus satsumensis TaxID=259059 RepID=UPI0021C4BD8B|nr:metal-sulfur cluster assembly factor [Liquorilactobacillus satsumensis]MCP9312329.1 metal-sulfur cluster assembly factor [Liquorilactobacillus satsumensis]MCP9327696.1 metal-sulfur cluster assembly factor [Liquorilactobacillus satsumensis]MCP9359667.1 metal-sulfur cluster assembly factor [Liquorilactobacillus satsumensis]